MPLGRHSATGVFRTKTEHLSHSSSDSSGSSSSDTSSIPTPWIERNITALECGKFLPARRSVVNSRCCCGLSLNEHAPDVKLEALARLGVPEFRALVTGGPNVAAHRIPSTNERWQVKTHTREMSTNAYGTVEFQGGPHPTRARYVRLHYDTSPEVVLQLLLHEWCIGVPNLVISTLGGLANAPLQSKLKRVVQSGLLRAAKTIGAWVITNGLDIGVTRHIGDALGDEVHVRGSNIVALGIAPWGYVQHRETLLGLDHTCAYYSQGWKPGRQEAPLHSHHNYFLLADNGTTGKFGGELCLRRRLEQYLAQQPIDMRRYGGSKSRVPIVGVLLEGGAQTFRTVFELVTGRNPVPVVVCDGSGRAADLLAFMHRYANEDGDLPGPLKEQMIGTIGRTFQLRRADSEGLYSELRLCMKRRRLISVFRMGEGDSDEIDITILTALLQVSSQKLTPAEQLSLVMAWDRPDIARTKVFNSFSHWSTTTLENAMADALLNDRLDFVRLLLAKGLDIQRFLTVGRLEDLYIAASDVNNQSFHKLFAKVMGPRQRITLRAIGQLIEDLVGGGYQHTYCDKNGSGQLPSPEHDLAPAHPHLYSSDPHLATTALQEEKTAHSYQNKSVTYANLEHAVAAVTGFQMTAHWHAPGSSAPTNTLTPGETRSSVAKIDTNIARNEALRLSRSYRFRYPYTELLQWALLTRRYEMARFMVLAGEESIAKALFSVKLLRSIRHATVDDDSEPDLAQRFRDQESAFERLAVELQDHCYRHDPDQAKRLLTYELHAFSDNTCLSLAYMCESKEFIGHACTQSILNDLWYGGLRQGRMVGAKVALILIGLVCPPIYPLIVYCFSTRSKFIEFKTKEELAKQPQTLQEHLDELESSSSSTSSSSSSRSRSSSSSSRSGHSSRNTSRRSSQCANPLALASHIDGVSMSPGPTQTRWRSQAVFGGLGDQPSTPTQPSLAPVHAVSRGSLHSTMLSVPEGNEHSRRGHHRRRKTTGSKRTRFRGTRSHRNSLSATEDQPPETENQIVPPTDIITTFPEAPRTKRRRRHRLFSRSRAAPTVQPTPPSDTLAPGLSEQVSTVANLELTPQVQSGAPLFCGTSETIAPLAPAVILPGACANREAKLPTVTLRSSLPARRSFFIPPNQNSGVMDGPIHGRLKHHRFSVHASSALPSSLAYHGTQVGKYSGPLRSNLASLLPSNHYASVAFTNRPAFRRRVNDTHCSGDVIKGEQNLSYSPTIHGVWDAQMENRPNDLSGLPTIFSRPNFLPLHEFTDVLNPSEPPYLDYPSNSEHSRPLSWRKRVYEFFSAPVTRFYLHVILYLVFLVLYIGLCIHTLPPNQWSWLELYVYLHIVTYLLDKFREVTLVRGTNYFQKMRVHLGAFWNVYDTIMCTLSVIGIMLRYMGMIDSSFYMWGKNLLILCCAIWQMRFLELMQIWRFSGPYIYMLLKMIRVLVPLLALLFLPLIAFGTVREGIMYPNRSEIGIEGIKGIMLKPYFMLYGEVYAGEIDPVDWPEDSKSAPLFEVVPIATVIYLLYSIILFISVVIATFNDIFAHVRQQSELVYNFLRYAVIIEYESRPLLPPPFIIISWTHLFARYLYRLRKKRRVSERDSSEGKGEPDKHSPRNSTATQHDRKPDESKEWEEQAQQSSFSKSHETSVGLKLFLQPAEVEKLHDFEEECVDDYWRQVRKNEKLDTERREDVINKKLDHLQFRIGEIHMHQNHLRGMVHLMEDHMRILDDNHYLSRPHITTHMAGPSDVECAPYTPSSPQPMQKDLIFAQTLLWLLSNHSNQSPTTDLISTQAGPNLAEIQNYLVDSLQTKIHQLKQTIATPASVGTSRMQASARAGVRDRSPSPSGRAGRQHRSGRTEHRVALSGPSWRADGTGTDRRPVHLGRSLHASYRGQDYAYREYTTICDEIDLSCLSFSDSSTTTPTCSRTDISAVGVGPIDGSAVTRPLKTPAFIVPSIQVCEDRNPVIPSPIPESDNVCLSIAQTTVPSIFSGSSASTALSAVAEITAESANPVVQSPIFMRSESPSAKLHTSTQSLSGADGLTQSGRLRAVSYTEDDPNAAHQLDDDQPSSFSAPEQLYLPYFLYDANQQTGLTSRLCGQTTRKSIRRTSLGSTSNPAEWMSQKGLHRRASARDPNFTYHIPNERLWIPGASESGDTVISATDLVDVRQAGLREAEHAERAELRGVLIRRLRKLSTASNSFRVISQTAQSTQPSRYPHRLLSSPCGSIAPSETPEVAHSDMASPVPSEYQVADDRLDEWEDTTDEKLGYNEPQISVDCRPASCSPNTYEAVGHRRYCRCHPILRHNNDVDAFSPADVGDFLSHNTREEDPVDPDLDLDLYSLATHTSSVRWSSDSPLRVPSANGCSTAPPDMDLQEPELLIENGNNDTRDNILGELSSSHGLQSDHPAPSPSASPSLTSPPSPPPAKQA